MIDSKLVKILKTFSGAELKEFKEFVNSPLYNKNSNVASLLNSIYDSAPMFDDISLLDEKKIFKSAFLREKFDKSKLKAYFSLLVNLAEKFMVIQESFSDDLKYKVALLKALNKRNLNGNFKYEAKHIEKLFAENSIKFEFDYYEILSEYKSTLSDFYFKLDFDKYLILENEHNRTKFLEFQMIFWNFFNSLNMNYSEHYEIVKDQLPLLEYFSAYIEERDTKEYKNEVYLVIIYYGFMMRYRKDGDTYYYKLKELWQKEASNMPAIIFRNSAVMLMNFCSTKLFQKSWYREYFDIVNFRIKNNGMLFDGYIEPSELFMVSRIALRLGELKWTSNFIETYKDKMLPDKKDRNTLYYLTMAYFHFCNSNFEKTVESLGKIDYQTPYTYMESKILLLHAYYELGFCESIYPLIDTVKHYIKRNAGALHLKSVPFYQNSLFVLEEMLRFTNGKKINFDKLYKVVHSNVILSQEWYLKKLEGIASK